MSQPFFCGGEMVATPDRIEVRQLVRRCLRGDDEATRALVRRYQDRVFGFCLKILRHRQDAEDAAQETLLRMVRSLHRWDDRRRFEPWLLAIAANRCRTLMARRAKRGATWPLRDVPCAGTRAEEVDAWHEEIALGLEQLRPEYRMALVLFHTNELTYQEIADVLECPIGTVRVWIHRARKQLWEWLASREMLERVSHAV